MTSEMVNPGTFTHTVGDTVRCVIKSIDTNPQQHILPDFWKSPISDTVRDWPQSLEQITTDGILVAVIVMFVCGLASYFIRNKKIGWIVLIGVPVLLAALFGWVLWKQSGTLLQPVKGPFFLVCMLLYGLAVLSSLGMIISSRNGLRGVRLWIPFVLISVYGFLVYDIGMFTGEGISLLTNAPMAVLYAFRIFVFNSDVSELQTPFHENWLYSANFALVHFLAAGLTTLFVIKHFGYSMIQKVRMWWIGMLGGDRSDTYLFWGYNDSVDYLAKSINEHYDRIKSNDYRIIVIRTGDDDDDTPESRTGFSRIFNFISMRNSEIDSLRDLGCLTVGVSNDQASMKSSDGDSSDILKGNLRLKSVCRILSRKTTKKVHVLLLSDDEKSNLHMANLLMKDVTIKRAANIFKEDEEAIQATDLHEKGQSDGHGGKDDEVSDNGSERQVTFYCLARYNSIHRVMEDKNSNRNLKIKIVDSSRISVEMLKDNKIVLPVNFVDVESDATVSSEFNAMVVGFSEVGEEAVRFLYEFGAFVKTGSTDDVAVRSKFHLDVVDKQMDDLAGTFISNAPAIKPSMPFIKGKENHDSLITLHKMDCRSAEFYLELEWWMKRGLNYIVIATEDDELNLSLGIRCFKLAARYRKDMERLCILVRMHRDEDGHGQEIVDYYNRLWAAQVHCPDRVGKGYQYEIRRKEKVDLPLRLFGQDIKTFTYENVVDDSIEKKAFRFKEKYEASKNSSYSMKEMPESKWVEEYKKKMYLNEKERHYHPSYGGIMSLRRMRGQDFANCRHAATKSELAQIALKKAGLPAFKWSLVERPDGSLEYYLSSGNPIDPRISRILRVLGQTEHLRWNSSHEILGYVRKGEPGYKDEVMMHHACLAPWSEIPNYQEFDFDVVDVTLGIITPEKPIKK